MRVNRLSPGLGGLLLITTSALGASFDDNLAAYARSIVSTVSARTATTPDHMIHVWHWETREEALVGQNPAIPPGPHDGRMISHLRFLQDTFRRAKGFGVAGPGLYAAVDPESSSSFGSLRFQDPPSWVLVQLVIRPGVRFFDMAKDKGVAAFSAELDTQIKAAGCDQGVGMNAQMIFRGAAADDFTPPPGLPPIPVDPGQAACKAVRDKLVALSFDPRDPARRTASAMKYQFTAATLNGCGPKSRFAFMMFGDDAINFDGLVIFGPDLPPRGDEHQLNRLMIQEMFARAGHPIDPWPSLAGLTASPALDLTAWMKDHIVNCAPGRFPEDANPPETPSP